MIFFFLALQERLEIAHESAQQHSILSNDLEERFKDLHQVCFIYHLFIANL